MLVELRLTLELDSSCALNIWAGVIDVSPSVAAKLASSSAVLERRIKWPLRPFRHADSDALRAARTSAAVPTCGEEGGHRAPRVTGHGQRGALSIQRDARGLAYSWDRSLLSIREHNQQCSEQQRRERAHENVEPRSR